MFSLAISNLATREPSPVDPNILAFEGESRLTTGLHKLVSQVVFLILTERGSIEGLPDFGSTVLASLGQISLSESARVNSVISDAIADITQQLQTTQEDLPDDERLDTLQLEAVSVESEHSLLVNISLRSLAGESAVYSTVLFHSEV